MVCLSEMISVRPIAGAINRFPGEYVHPSLGFAVGVIYWYQPRAEQALASADSNTFYRLAYTTSLVTLTVSGALLLPYTTPISAWLSIPIVLIATFNFFSNIKV